jgi:succinate dehydrogenase / fumarate reductase iron-sulfur subunit
LIEAHRGASESTSDFAARENAVFDQEFFGAHAMNQVVLINSHPTGRHNAAERLDAAMQVGGVQVCGKAQNCTAVCPKRIPLTDSWGRIGRATTVRAIKWLFDG